MSSESPSQCPEPIRRLLACYLHEEASEEKIHIPQFAYRRRLVGDQVWNIRPGMNILEIGCGQGECTLVLAQAVGQAGTVIGIDPAPADYGEPTTLAESQGYIMNSPLGSNVKFKQASVEQFVASSSRDELGRLDAVVLCHSLWYFPSARSVEDLFGTLASAGIRKAMIADWHAVLPDGPRAEAISAHYHAAMVERRFHELVPQDERGQNVRSALSREEIVHLAKKSGWSVETTGTLEMEPGMQDGWWEIGWVSSDRFEDNLEAVEDEDERHKLKEIIRLQVRSKIDAKYHQCMDSFWVILQH